MNAASGHSALAPFRVRSFRFQWPADLATSWAWEMETLILAWYVLVSTGSVLLLTLFASLNYIGTLLAPLFGVIGHRIGERNLLCAMRAFYATLAAALTAFALAGALTPVHVFIFATLMGIVRPSDLAIRFSVIGNTLPPAQLMGGMSISRTTQDSARIMGALTGAGVFALLGMGPALSAIAFLYATSFVLTLRVSNTRPGDARADTEKPQSHWRDLKDAIDQGRWKSGLAADDVIRIFAKAVNMPEAVIRGMTPQFPDADGDINVESLRMDLAFFKESGDVTSKTITADEIVDLTFAKAAAKELGPYKAK